MTTSLGLRIAEPVRRGGDARRRVDKHGVALTWVDRHPSTSAR